MSDPTGWVVERCRGTAADLHGASADLVAGRTGPVRRTIRVHDVSEPAVVLGSAQRPEVVDAGRAAAAGVSVAKRPSGGGAVLVGPGEGAWVDVVIPAGDPEWRDDVGRAMWWIGEAWRVALDADRSRPPATVWHGALVRTEWSGLVCFGGLGPGEVTVEQPDGAAPKVVGVSQRRTRAGALFQCAVLARWEPARLLDLLTLEPGERAVAAIGLAGAGAGVGAAAWSAADALVAGLVGRDGRCQDDGDGSA